MYYLSDYDYQRQQIRNDNDEIIGYVVLADAMPGETKWIAFLPGFVFLSGIDGDNPEECAENFIEKYYKRK